MGDNFTPLDVEKIKKTYTDSHDAPEQVSSDFDGTLNTVLLALATITILVLCIVFFILIQKKISGKAYYQPLRHIQYA